MTISRRVSSAARARASSPGARLHGACRACNGPADERESIATIHAALDRGITLIDTGDFYGTGHNEMLIGRALADRRDRALLSVKFGAMRAPDGSWAASTRGRSR